MKNKFNIPVISGTAREGCSSRDVFSFVQSYLSGAVEGVEFPAVRVADFSFGRTYEPWNEHEEKPEIAEWQQIAAEADAFIIVAPEYNHSFPGELKILLDAAFEEYFDKPVMLVGVSSGSFGGARMVEHIKPVLLELGMKPTGHDIFVSDVGEVFDDDGEIKDSARDTQTKRLDAAAEALIDDAEYLRDVREG